MKRAMLLCIVLCMGTASALAAPSISELEQPKTAEINVDALHDDALSELETDIVQVDVDLSRLKQLTYMQDFKRESTGWRISYTAGQSRVIEGSIDGGEVTKAGKIEDFVIIQ